MSTIPSAGKASPFSFSIAALTSAIYIQVPNQCLVMYSRRPCQSLSWQEAQTLVLVSNSRENVSCLMVLKVTFMAGLYTLSIKMV